MGGAFLKSILRGKSICFEGVPRIPLAEFSGPNFFLGALEAGPQDLNPDKKCMSF
jgi:hypothetical protein